MNQLEKVWWGAVMIAAGLGGVAFWLIGTVTFFIHVVSWLKYAVWPHYTILDALHAVDIPAPYIRDWAGHTDND